MTEQQTGTGRTSISLTPAARERLAQFERAIAKAEDRYVTAGQAVERLMDWADAADLP